jgi:hypothetical protein
VLRLAKAQVIPFHKSRAAYIGAVGDCEPHGGTIDVPTGRHQCGFESLPQLSVSELIDDLLKFRFRESQCFVEEALADLQRVIDHQRGHAVGLQTDSSAQIAATDSCQRQYPAIRSTLVWKASR